MNRAIFIFITSFALITSSCKEEYVPMNAGKEIKHLTGTWLLYDTPPGVYVTATIYHIDFCLDNCYQVRNGNVVDLPYEYEVKYFDDPVTHNPEIYTTWQLDFVPDYNKSVYAIKESNNSLRDFDGSIFFQFESINAEVMIMKNYLGDTIKYHKVQLPNIN